MFNFQEYNQKYIRNPSNDAKYYGVSIIEEAVPEGEYYYRCIGIHHLTPDENRSKQNCFIEVLDENNQRINIKKVFYAGWDWDGRHFDQNNPAAPLDKPDNEPFGNLVIWSNQVLSVWMIGIDLDNPVKSDRVINIHTLHADERGPNGEIWNSIGHHSFYLVFRKELKGQVTIPGPIEPPPGNEESYEQGFKDGWNSALNRAKEAVNEIGEL